MKIKMICLGISCITVLSIYAMEEDSSDIEMDSPKTITFISSDKKRFKVAAELLDMELSEDENNTIVKIEYPANIVAKLVKVIKNPDTRDSLIKRHIASFGLDSRAIELYKQALTEVGIDFEISEREESDQLEVVDVVSNNHEASPKVDIESGQTAPSSKFRILVGCACLIVCPLAIGAIVGLVKGLIS